MYAFKNTKDTLQWQKICNDDENTHFAEVNSMSDSI